MATCNHRTCFVKFFEPGAFNICAPKSFSLRYIDGTKGRGLVAEKEVPKGALIALFPGAETVRIPEHSSLPASEYGQRDDRELLEREQETLPLSDYAITAAVLDLDPATEEAVGYHYRILDPIADDAAGDELRQLWEQHRDLDFWWPDEPEALPEHIVTLTVFKAKTQYERLKQTVKALRQAPVVSPRLYEFVLDDRQSFGGWIMLHIDGRFHFICERDKLHEEASARRNIVLALNAEWDVKRHRRLGLAARAKALMLSDAYPHMVAFANQPYKHERANAAFVDPKDWIPSTSRRTPAHCPAEARLVRETQSEMTPERLDYLQRQAVVTTRPIRCGEEVLLDYNRDWRV